VIKDILEKIALHQHRLKCALQEMQEWDSMEQNLFEDFDRIKTVDTFIYRFIKLQDMMGEKLFKIFLDEIGEYRDDMSLLDVLDKLEKFKIIDDAHRWMSYRKLRNQLTHEYPDNEEEVLEGIGIAMESYEHIERIIENIIAYCEDKRLHTER